MSEWLRASSRLVLFFQEELWDERQQAGTLSHWTNPTQFANLVIFLVVKVRVVSYFLCLFITLSLHLLNHNSHFGASIQNEAEGSGGMG